MTTSSLHDIWRQTVWFEWQENLSDKLVFVPFLSLCLYSMTGNGRTAQKDYIGAKIDFRAQFRVNMSLVAFWKLVAPLPMLVQNVNGSSYWQRCMPKCTFFKRVLAVCKISLSDELLSSVLLKNVSSWVASRPIRLHMILWITTKSFLILLFSRVCNFSSLCLSS